MVLPWPRARQLGIAGDGATYLAVAVQPEAMLAI